MTRFLSLCLLLLATTAGAQDASTIVRVVDPSAEPVPFAWVQLKDGVSRVADDSGRVVFSEEPGDSARLLVRRIGYDPYYDWVDRSETGEFVVRMRLLPKSIQTLTVSARADTPLARTGFYDRLQRIQKGAFSARMITPEELEMRNPIQLSQVLRGDPTINVRRVGMNGVMLTGRGGMCAMSILLDGMRVTGTYEESLSNRTNPPPISSLVSVDNLINANNVAAIEIYSSGASIPTELQRTAGDTRCGLVAVWTGRRR